MGASSVPPPGRRGSRRADPHVERRLRAYVRGAELGPVAAILRTSRDEILRRWLEAARLQSFHTAHPDLAVADHIPPLFDALVAFLERNAPRGVDPSSPLDDRAVREMARAHARDRFARGLAAADVLIEFRLLRQEIGRALRERTDVLAAELLVHDALDGAATLALAALEAHEAEYHRMAAELVAIVESSSDAIIGKTLDGIITSWNPAAERLYGYTAAEAVGRSINLILPADRPDELPSILARIRRGERVEPYETVRVRKDGSRLAVSVTISPVRDAAGAVVGASAIARDISEHKRAEAAARQARAELEAERGLLDALFRTAPIGFAFLDRDLRYVRINERLAEINGRPTADHLGRTGREMVPELAEQAEPLLRRVLETGEPILDVPVSAELPSSPGEVRHWRVSHYPVQDAGGAVIGVGVVAIETTAQVRAEAALRESEERFRTLADNIAQLAWMADAQGCIFWYNRRWFEYTGTTLEQMQGWGWTRVHHPDHVERVVARIRRSWETGELWEDTFPLRGKDGQYRWFLSRALPIRDEAGRIVRWFGTNTDITELRRLTERQALLAEAGSVLAGSLEYQATLANVARLIVPRLADWCVVDVLGARAVLGRIAVVHADPTRVRLAEELRQRYPPDPGSPYGAPRVLRTGQPELVPDIPDAVFEQTAHDPEHLALLRGLGLRSYMVVPLRARGQVLGVISLVAAESGRRYGAEDLRTAQELADRAALAIDNARLYREAQEAVRQREQLLAVVAHDLKNPLMAIKGTADLLQRRAATGRLDPDRLTDRLTMIGQATMAMTAQIGELLDAARLRAGQPLELDRRPTDLVALAQRVAAQVQQTTTRHTIDVHAAVPELIGEWDGVRLERVLGNLLGNAVKYSPEGTDVSVEVRHEQEDGQAWACVRVRDRGIGIPAADLPHIFERYHRAANVVGRFPGEGIGLAGARQVIEQHGGTIDVRSHEGQGSTFTVQLPLTPVEQRA
jgi:PAS domain S-box-containing protein